MNYMYIIGISLSAIINIFTIDALCREKHIIPAFGGDIFLVVSSFVLSSFVAYIVYLIVLFAKGR